MSKSTCIAVVAKVNQNIVTTGYFDINKLFNEYRNSHYKVKVIKKVFIFMVGIPIPEKTFILSLCFAIFQLRVISSRYGPMPRVGGLVPLTTKVSGPHSTACTPRLK